MSRRYPPARWVEVTPKLAAEWLKKNIENNRRVNQRREDRYTRDMSAGRWPMTGDTIQFDTEGRLMNGQHRLRALIRAGVTLPFLVVREVPVDAFKSLDQHGARPTAAFLDGTHKNQRIAVVRMVLAYRRSEGASILNALSSRDEELTCESELGDSLMESMKTVCAHPCRILTNSLAAFLHLTFKQFDAQAADEFMEKVMVGEGVTGPIYLLREKLWNETKMGKFTQQQRTWLTFRVWNAWRKKERLTKLQLPKGGDVPGAAIDLRTVTPI